MPNQHQQQLVHHQKTLLSRTRSYAPGEVPHPDPSLQGGYNGALSHSMSHSRQSLPQGSNEHLHQRLQRQLSINPYEESGHGHQNGALNGGPFNGHPNGTVNGHNGAPNGYATTSGHPNGLMNAPQNVGATNERAYEEVSQQERMRLRYHLSSLFPEEQVVAAMQAHPGETSAHVLCATILNMFPPSR